MKMKLSYSVVAILALVTIHLAEANHTSAFEARQLADHPVMRSVRKSFVEEIADYFNSWVFHNIDRQARSNFKEVFGVDSNDAMKASKQTKLLCSPFLQGQRADLFISLSFVIIMSHPFRAGTAHQDLRMVCLPPGRARFR